MVLAFCSTAAAALVLLTWAALVALLALLLREECGMHVLHLPVMHSRGLLSARSLLSCNHQLQLRHDLCLSNARGLCEAGCDLGPGFACHDEVTSGVAHSACHKARIMCSCQRSNQNRVSPAATDV
jgi:hypothetical protein